MKYEFGSFNVHCLLQNVTFDEWMDNNVNMRLMVRCEAPDKIMHLSNLSTNKKSLIGSAQTWTNFHNWMRHLFVVAPSRSAVKAPIRIVHNGCHHFTNSKIALTTASNDVRWFRMIEMNAKSKSVRICLRSRVRTVVKTNRLISRRRARVCMHTQTRDGCWRTRSRYITN